MTKMYLGKNLYWFDVAAVYGMLMPSEFSFRNPANPAIDLYERLFGQEMVDNLLDVNLLYVGAAGIVFCLIWIGIEMILIFIEKQIMIQFFHIENGKSAHWREIKKGDKHMKQIINGKMYDTETTERIGCDSNGMGCEDLWFAEETLYRKKNGEFFLDGHGAPLSRYSRPNGSFSRCGARELVPLDDEAAKIWVERHSPVDVYIETFGSVTE